MKELSFLSKLSTLRGLSVVINRLGNGLPRVYGEMTKSEYVHVSHVHGLVWCGLGVQSDLHGPVTKLASANAAISKTAVTVTSLNSGCCVDSDGRLVTLPVKTPLFAELQTCKLNKSQTLNRE